MEYQIWAWDRDGKVLHAGIHKLGNVSQHTIIKLERKWQIWRRHYLATHKGNYPLCDDVGKTARWVSLWPVACPTQRRDFVLGEF